MPITFIVIVLLVTSRANEFIIPDACDHFNKGGYPTTNLTWNCYVNKDEMSCWLDLEELFGRFIQQENKFSVSIKYQCGIWINSYNTTQTDRCLILDVKCEPGVTVFNISTRFNDGSESSIRSFQFNNSRFVKPLSILKVNVIEPVDTTSVSLQWKLPICYKQREVRIRFHSQYSKPGKERWQERTKLLENNDFFSKLYNNDLSCNDCQMNLTNLTAFTMYDIEIDSIFTQAKGRIGFWSDGIKLQIKTAEDVPTAVPTFLPGYFSTVNSSHLKIYWNPIPAANRCGIIIHYRITVTEIGNTSESQEILAPPEYFYAIIPANTHSNLLISLTQRTSKGYPDIRDANIYVMSEPKRPKHPEEFIVEAFNKSTVLLSWSVASNYTEQKIVSYTVFWCHLTLLKVCSKPLQSTLFSLTNNLTRRNNTTIYLAGNYTRFDFGVSMEVEVEGSNVTSSGIKWFRDCIYELNGEVRTRLYFKIHPSGENQIFLNWKPYTCQDSGGVIEAFLIKYCPIVNNVCLGSTIINVSMTTHSFLIRDLLEGHNYSIQMGSKHKYQDSYGLWSIPVFYIVPVSGTPDSVPNVIIQVLGICFIVAIVFTVIIWCTCIRKYPARITRNPSITLIPISKDSSNTNENRKVDSGLGISSPTRESTISKQETEFNDQIDYLNSAIPFTDSSIDESVYREVKQIDSVSETESESYSNQESHCGLESNETEASYHSENRKYSTEKHDLFDGQDSVTTVLTADKDQIDDITLLAHSITLSCPEKLGNSDRESGIVNSYCRTTDDTDYEVMSLLSGSN